MDFLEKDLEDIIYEASQTKEGRNFLMERNLPIQSHGKMYRQVRLGSYGVADLIDISMDSVIDKCDRSLSLHVEIIELKKDLIDYKALGQSCRYFRAVKDMANLMLDNERFDEYDFHISLIGSGIDNSDNDSFLFLYNEISDFADIFTYKYKMDGIFFEYIPHTWHKTNPNFDQEVIKNIQHPAYSDLRHIVEVYDCRGSLFYNN